MIAVQNERAAHRSTKTTTKTVIFRTEMCAHCKSPAECSEKRVLSIQSNNFSRTDCAVGNTVEKSERHSAAEKDAVLTQFFAHINGLGSISVSSARAHKRMGTHLGGIKTTMSWRSRTVIFMYIVTAAK